MLERRKLKLKEHDTTNGLKDRQTKVYNLIAITPDKPDYFRER